MKMGMRTTVKMRALRAVLAPAVALALLPLAPAPASAEAREVPASAVARLKVPADARIVSAAAPKGRSGRVEKQACVANKPAAAVAEDTRAALAVDWGKIEVIPNQTLPG